MTKYIWGLTELDMHILEKGSSAGFLFNIAIVLLSTALNLFIVLLTTPVGSLIIYTIIFAIFWTSALLGFIFLFQWYRKNSKTKDIMEKIKKIGLIKLQSGQVRGYKKDLYINIS